jgi:hypothetical protein
LSRLVTSLGLIAALAVVSGCGTGTVTTSSVSSPPPTTPVTTATSAPGVHHAPRHVNNPAQQPDPSVTAGCNEVPVGHACKASTSAPEDPNISPQRNCDTNIVANSRTSCGLAENTFYEYYQAHETGSKLVSMMVHSATTGKDYELGCSPSKGLIACESSPTSDYLFVTFPEVAVTEYTDAQAKAYGRTRDVGHPGRPAAALPAPAPSKSTPAPAPSEGEDEVGSYSHATDEAFCQGHTCIGDFENESGTVAECNDGTYSHSGHIQGACSHHEGVRQD